MTETEVKELSYEDLADPVEADVDWDRAGKLLAARKCVGNHQITAVFKALERVDSEAASREQLYDTVRDEYNLTQHAFKEGLGAVSNAGLVPRYSSDSNGKRQYRAGAYTDEEWRAIEGKTHRVMGGDF